MFSKIVKMLNPDGSTQSVEFDSRLTAAAVRRCNRQLCLGHRRDISISTCEQEVIAAFENIGWITRPHPNSSVLGWFDFYKGNPFRYSGGL